MEAIIQAKNLKAQVGALQGILARKETVPVLSKIKIVAGENGDLVMTATDLDVTLIVEQETDVLKPGAICLNGRKFGDIAQTLPNEPVHLKLDDKGEQVELKVGRYKTKLSGADADAFPEIARSGGNTLKIPASFLYEGLRRTIFAVSEDKSRFLLNSVLLVAENSQLKLISTDGHRLCYFRVATTAAASQSLECLIPSKAVRELKSLLADEFRLNEKSEIKISKGAQLEFAINNKVLTAREPVGSFPNWQMVLPKNHRRFAEINAKEMREALMRVGVLADDAHRRVEFIFFPDKVTLVSRSPETGESVEEVGCRFQSIGEQNAEEDNAVRETGWRIALNAKYIVDFFNLHASKKDDQRIVWKFGEPNEQTEMIYEGEEKLFSYILVPLKT